MPLKPCWYTIVPSPTPPLDTVVLTTLHEQDARNIPETMRINMRGLTSRIKVELVKKHSSQSSEAIPTIRTQGLSLFNNGLAEEKLVRKSSDERIEKKGGTGNSKSKLFTFSRPGSPSKVKKDTSPRKTLRERPVSYHGAVSYHGSAKELLLPPGKTSYQTKGSQTTMHNCATADDFIMYLQRVDRPEEIEVAMLHKLRLLLRNETVAWVQDFESKGGMTEVMKLLQRTMAIEWR